MLARFCLLPFWEIRDGGGPVSRWLEWRMDAPGASMTPDKGPTYLREPTNRLDGHKRTGPMWPEGWFRE